MQWRSVVAVIAAASGIGAIVACGGSGDSNGTARSDTRRATDIKPGKQGGTLTVLSAGDVDYVDPGQTYYTFGYMVHYAVNRTLYSFKPDDSVNPVPDLAEGKPDISSDGRSITVRIKRGVKFSPPVSREVKAADIKYAVERAFSKNVPSGYAGAYFSSIEGAPESGSTPIADISGITTPDDYTIVFKLSEPQAPTVSQALVMPITTPVPKEYAKKYDEKSPSTYNRHVVFTGPYMIRNDSSGELVGWSPGKSMEIIRNPNWDKATDYRPAYLDRIRIAEGNSDLALAGRRTLTGDALICCDSTQPPAQILRRAVAGNRDQLLLVPAGGTYYITMNTKLPPFDDVNIRKAIIAASDRTALRQTTGGPLVGPIAHGWLPPGIPGFAEAGGLKQNVDLDFSKRPEGDPAVAKKYMLAAKQQDSDLPIDAEGRWTGNERFLTIAVNADPGRKTAQVFQNQVERLGFKLNLRFVPADTMFTKFLTVPKTNVAFAPNMSWFKDFSDAQSLLDATFNGDNIVPQGNVNISQLDVRAINDAMKRAASQPVGPARSQAWANVNHMIAEQAPAIPWLWLNAALLQSRNVVGVANGYMAMHDLNFTSLK
jgi:peptide/nickel transport system substrate-binding protein